MPFESQARQILVLGDWLIVRDPLATSLLYRTGVGRPKALGEASINGSPQFLTLLSASPAMGTGSPSIWAARRSFSISETSAWMSG